MRPTVAIPVMLLAAAAQAHAAGGQRIDEIEVTGNTKTSSETVKLIADVHEGDEWSYDVSDRVKTDLRSCGLFQEVDLFTQPTARGGLKVVILAKEKFSWIIAPTFYTQPGNVGGGIGYGENNLFGHNKKLLLYGQIATADTFFFGVYLDPSIMGTRWFWRGDVYLRHSNITEYAAPDGFLGQPDPARETTLNYLNLGAMIGLHLWREVSLSLRLHGADTFYRDTHSPIDDMPMPAPEVDGWDVATEIQIDYDQRANWNGVFAGTKWGFWYERSLPDLGSTYDYWDVEAWYEYDKKIFDTHNLVMRFWGGYGWHLPFQQEFTSGGNDLRGYKVMQFRGDFKFTFRPEYSLQLFWTGPLAWRALAFWDTAYTALANDTDGNSQRNYLPGETGHDVSRWRNGIGAGIRVYVKSIVLPLLGVDVGYGLEANDYHIYFAIGLTNL